MAKQDAAVTDLVAAMLKAGAQPTRANGNLVGINAALLYAIDDTARIVAAS